MDKSQYDVIIWGGKTKNLSQEKDLLNALLDQDINATITNNYSENIPTGDKIIIRNLFYSTIDDLSNYESSNSIKSIRSLEETGKVINSIDGLMKVRDKLEMTNIFEKLDIPHIKTYKLDNNSKNLLEWINQTENRSNNGVIIKDRFGGLGKGIVKVKKQGSFYLTDISCVEGSKQKYINETFSANELRNVFDKYLNDYKLIGQPYVPSAYEFSNPGESESIRVVDIGGNDFISMRRIAQSPINNMSLTKNNIRTGGVEKTDTTNQEKEFSNKITNELGLFFVGHDFIRTKVKFYDSESSIYVPERLKDKEEISVILEVNGLLQYGGIQELYQDECDISELVAKNILNQKY